MEENFKKLSERLNIQLAAIAVEVKLLVKHSELDTANIGFTPNQKEVVGEMKANIMLSYRHLEDAHHRLSRVQELHSTIETYYPTMHPEESSELEESTELNDLLFSQRFFEGKIDGEGVIVDSLIGKPIKYGDKEIGMIESAILIGEIIQYKARIYKKSEELFKSITEFPKIFPSIGFSIEEPILNKKRNIETEQNFIVVNGRKIAWDKDEISYETLMVLVGYKIDDIVSVTFSRGWIPSEGILYPNKTVPTITGMSFSAVITGNA
jgi:hypothetical protein